MRRALLAIAALALAGAVPAAAHHTTPGNVGQTKVDVYDNTHNGWNVNTTDPLTGGADPTIGFVNYRATVPDDPNHAIFVVALKDAAPNCRLRIDVVTDGADSGLEPDANHSGSINPIGSITTNAKGKANSGEIVVDVRTLSGTAGSGAISAAHVDLEPLASCTEADDSPVSNNEYGASGAPDGYVGATPLPSQIHWLQP